MFFVSPQVLLIERLIVSETGSHASRVAGHYARRIMAVAQHVQPESFFLYFQCDLILAELALARTGCVAMLVLVYPKMLYNSITTTGVRPVNGNC